LALSVLGHGLIVMALIASGANGADLLSGDGLGDVEAMEVSLVGAQIETTPTLSPVADPAAELLARLGAVDSQALSSRQDAPPPPPERVSLDELLNDTAAAKGTPNGRTEGAERTREGVKAAKGEQVGGAQRARGGAAGRGGLWSVIEPCWRRQQLPPSAHARLVVRLDLMGRLASPPRIVRDGATRLDQDQMLSETRALDALTACLPAALGQFTGEHVLDFTPR